MGKTGNHMARIDDFNIVGRLYVSGRHNPFTVFAQAQRDLFAVVEFENHTFEIEKNVHNIFLNTVN